MKQRTLVLAAALLAGLVSCSNSSDDLVADVTEQDIEYGYSITGQQVGVQGFCVPALSVEQVLRDNDAWEEFGDRIESIEVTKIEYRVPANATPSDGRIELSVGEAAEFDPDAVEQVAATQTIPAATTVEDFERVNWLGDGRATLNDYVAGYETDDGVPYFLCGLFRPEPEEESVDVDLTLDLIVTFKVTVLPIG